MSQAIIEGVVIDYKDMYKDAVEKNMSSAAELPYFEGDFWTTILEDCVKVCFLFTLYAEILASKLFHILRVSEWIGWFYFS